MFRDAVESPARDAGVEIIRRCWTEERFDYEGKRSSVQDVAVQLKPFQQSHPLIWLGGMRGSAVDRVARLADGFHFIGTPEEIVAMFKQHLEEVPLTGTIMQVPPGIEHQRVLRCMELVAREVMPHFVD